MMWIRYIVWVPAGAKKEKEICKYIMTSAECREAVMVEVNPFGNFLHFVAKPTDGDAIMAKYVSFDWNCSMAAY